MANAQDRVLLDVRPILPKERHGTIHAVFGKLESGQSMMLVNDHDPKPLYYEFSAERPGMFDWDYVEKGPEVWSVIITKTA